MAVDIEQSVENYQKLRNFQDPRPEKIVYKDQLIESTKAIRDFTSWLHLNHNAIPPEELDNLLKHGLDPDCRYGAFALVDLYAMSGAWEYLQVLLRYKPNVTNKTLEEINYGIELKQKYNLSIEKYKKCVLLLLDYIGKTNSHLYQEFSRTLEIFNSNASIQT